MMAALYAAGPAFQETLVGQRGGDKLVQLWDHIRDTPWCPLENGDDVSRCVPFTMHGDFAPSYNGESALVVSWASPLVGGGSRGKNLLVTVVAKNRLVPHVTLQQIFAFLVWSFNALIAGVWPTVPFASEEVPGAGLLAGGWKGRWFGLKGDLEFLLLAC